MDERSANVNDPQPSTAYGRSHVFLSRMSFMLTNQPTLVYNRQTQRRQVINIHTYRLARPDFGCAWGTTPFLLHSLPFHYPSPGPYPQIQLTGTIGKRCKLPQRQAAGPAERIVLLSVGIHTDKCVISGLLSVWIRTAVCASIYHTIHTLALTLTLILSLTLNLTLISSYLTKKHQYPQPNMSAN